MTARVGIELSPSACRIVEIDGQPAWARRPRETRVRSFAVLPPSGPETRAKLQSLGGRIAAVIVWNASSEHRQVVVTGGSYESMRAEALTSLAAAGLQTQGAVADIAPVGGHPARGVRRPVVAAIASASELSAALQPLREAGIRLRTVTTPAVALGSLARLRRAFSVPGAIEAYVALEQADTCIALVRNSVLVGARELPWGYIDQASGIARSREEIASRLADCVTEFVAAIGGGPRDLGQVCVCGALPELRSMTAPLMERLDVEVEPLDSLFGIDAAHVPQPADEFRERSVELRLAWAIAADWPPPINLLRAQRRRTSKTILARSAVAAGVAAGLAVGWRVQGSHWWQSRPPQPQARTATNAAARERTAGPGPAPAPRVTPPPADVGPRLPAVGPPPDARPGMPPVAMTPPPAVARSQPSVGMPPPDAGPRLLPHVVAPPAAVAQSRPPVVPPAVAAQSKPAVAPPPRQEPPRSAASSPGVTPLMPRLAGTATTGTAPPQSPRQAARAARLEPAPARPAPAAASARTEPAPRPVEPSAMRTDPQSPPRIDSRARTEPQGKTELAPPRTDAAAPRPSPPARSKAVPQEMALPFDAALGTILYSPDRKLAIIDGRIVGAGDEVRGARVIDITPTAVMLRDAHGHLRRLALAAGGR